MSTTIAASQSPPASGTARRLHRAAVWLTAIVLPAAAAAVWLLVATSSAHQSNTPAPPLTTVKSIGVSHQPDNSLCYPHRVLSAQYC